MEKNGVRDSLCGWFFFLTCDGVVFYDTCLLATPFTCRGTCGVAHHIAPQPGVFRTIHTEGAKVNVEILTLSAGDVGAVITTRWTRFTLGDAHRSCLTQALISDRMTLSLKQKATIVKIHDNQTLHF